MTNKTKLPENFDAELKKAMETLGSIAKESLDKKAKESIDKYPPFVFSENPSDFHFENIFNYNNVVENILDDKGIPEVAFPLFLQADIFVNILSNYIISIEGISCSTDKVNFVLKRLLSILRGKPLKIEGEHHFWNTRLCLRDDEFILEFYKAILSFLEVGDYKKLVYLFSVLEEHKSYLNSLNPLFEDLYKEVKKSANPIKKVYNIVTSTYEHSKKNILK